MEKSIFYETLKGFEKGTMLKLKWDRGNGTLEGIVCFEGFEENSPLLYFNNRVLLDIDKIGGYNSIISIGESPFFSVGAGVYY